MQKGPHMNLKKIRIEKKLSVPELSRRSGVPVRTIENIEKTDHATVSNAIKLADAIGVTLDTLCRDRID